MLSQFGGLPCRYPRVLSFPLMAALSSVDCSSTGRQTANTLLGGCVNVHEETLQNNKTKGKVNYLPQKQKKQGKCKYSTWCFCNCAQRSAIKWKQRHNYIFKKIREKYKCSILWLSKSTRRDLTKWFRKQRNCLGEKLPLYVRERCYKINAKT